MQASFGSSISSYISSYIKEALPCSRAAQGTVMLAHFFPMKKRFASDVSDTFATCSDLVHDDTDTDWWAHSGSFHGRVCVTFKYVF